VCIDVEAKKITQMKKCVLSLVIEPKVKGELGHFAAVIATIICFSYHDHMCEQSVAMKCLLSVICPYNPKPLHFSITLLWLCSTVTVLLKKLKLDTFRLLISDALKPVSTAKRYNNALAVPFIPKIVSLVLVDSKSLCISSGSKALRLLDG
jgi:hypothetical protein